MKKVLIAYVSRTGMTAKMADYIAEGVRFSGNEAETKKISELKSDKELEGYDAYIFGSPTYHKDTTEGMKTFLFLCQKVKLGGKPGGAFGSHTHSGEAPGIIFDTMEHVFKMDMVNLGGFALKESLVNESEGMRACQDYGKEVAKKF
ncbi:flavodoxin domain-containing protein [Nitrospirota bacterium]